MTRDARQVEEVVLAVLRDAHEPVREAVLYERVRSRGARAEPEAFLDAVERLATLGHVRIAVEHDMPARDPAPFQPRFYYPVD